MSEVRQGVEDPQPALSAVNQEPEFFPAFAFTEREQKFRELGWEAYKAAVPNLNAALQRMVTLASALIGGSLVFLKDDRIDRGLQLWACGLFLLSLLVAFTGSMPLGRHVNLSDPADIEAFKDQTARRKTAWLVTSFAAMVAGFVVVIAGMWVKG